MSQLKIKGDKSRYEVRAPECIGLECLRLGHYQVRGGTMSGSRNTGRTSPCCMFRAYHGCPTPILEFDKELAAKRKGDGLSKV